jgi:hypothetical protein
MFFLMFLGLGWFGEAINNAFGFVIVVLLGHKDLFVGKVICITFGHNKMVLLTLQGFVC